MTAVPMDLSVLLADADFQAQRAFGYPAGGWNKWTGHLSGVAGVLSVLPPTINRAQVAGLVEDLLPDNVIGAFVVSMIWGYGTSNVGPFRTARILTQQHDPGSAGVSDYVRDRLDESVVIARRDGAVEGYRYLNNRDGRVDDLGPAFFTKWLYFVTARGNSLSPHAAPVLDALIIQWLDSRAGIRLRRSRTSDYLSYIDLLETWGRPHELTAVEVEERIFRVIRNDGARPTAE